MNTMKRLLAMLLALSVVLSLAACGAPKQDALQDAQQQEDTLDREDKELIAELIGGQEDASDLTDEELDTLVQELIGTPEKDTATSEKDNTSDIINLSAGQKQEQPSVDVTENKDAYDENGAMTKPFDQVYPELIEKEEVTFSGESILIKMASDKLTDGLKAAGVGALEEIVPMEKEAWYEAKLVDGTDAQKALAAVRELDEVLLAEYNYEIQTAALDGYKEFNQDEKDKFDKNGHHKDQWHMHHCGIVDGYEQMENDGGDSSVIVAVIDSGVDYEHEDLKDNMWVNAKEIPDNGRDDDGNGYIDDYYGVDIIAGKGNGGDTNGHGTHVAGIIAARNNNVGVLGIAYNVKIMSVKAAMHNGTLNQADIAKAVLYAYNNGAEVINMSFGGSACSIAVQDALATAYTRCVLVASAGNSGENNEPTDKDPIAVPNYPAALTYVLGVMSVDEAGRESVFTNWDVFPFNGVEYELYAPGENIMSTLPGNKYGFLSGTSMAAPVVSAFAAILRSEFADRDKYPTKFIYGQLASTSEIHADCVDPEAHAVFGKPHNLPQVADLHAALTKLPKPEVNLQDYALFDDPKYSDKNNGDGVIDAGETIALGLTLRNRWGMSENTLVTIDTISQSSGLADPYFTIVNPTVDYGSVGTYSTQDCGRIYTDELLTGWENPFLIKVSEDCPNDYRFTLNVTITCENALDEEDTTVYTSEGQVNENVRAGFVLPSIIDEDMVLTPENLYIIPNATIIQEGVTVKVEPGTHIQFWSDDANDPYADSYIAYLLVNGNFLVEGTKENPVQIYPSQLMDRYNVEIASTGKGYVSLKYADVTNLMVCRDNTSYYNRIDLADHCTFRNNYGTSMYYRYVSGGTVCYNYNSSGTVGVLEKAKDCVFYKLGLKSGQTIYGNFDRCIFNQCGIDFQQGYVQLQMGDSWTYIYSYFKNCVFLGNDFVDQTDPNHHNNSSMSVSTSAPTVRWVCYRPETGTTYVAISNANGLAQQFLAEALDLETVPYAIIETPEEAQWLAYRIWGNGYSSYYENYDVGLRFDEAAGKMVWSDGSAIDAALDPDGVNNGRRKNVSLRLYRDISNENIQQYGGELVNYIASRTKSTYYALFEIPGPILPTDITFEEYTVDMDLQTSYQLTPRNTPVQIPADQFLYESTDEAVITVSDTGLVTPVGKGTADVWVYSQDRAVKNRVTVTVRDYVALESLAFPAKSMKLEVGVPVYAPCILTPADTTRRNVTYTTSDPDVVTVQDGLLTAVGKGTATITATCEGLSTTMEITTWVRATKLTPKVSEHTRRAEDCDTSLPELSVSPANADLDLQWTSEDNSILSVEDGKLQLKNAGSTYLRVTDQNSGLSTSFYFTVTFTPPVIRKDAIAVQMGTDPVSLPEVTLAAGAETTPVWAILDPAVAELKDGKIQFNGAGITTLRVTDPRTGRNDEIFLYVTEGAVPKIKDLQAIRSEGSTSSYMYALMENGDLYYWHASATSFNDPELICSDVAAFDGYNSYVTVLQKDNTVKTYIGTALQATYTELQTQSCVDIAGYQYKSGSSTYGNLYVLTEDGTVYSLGSNNGYGQLGTGDTAAVTEFTKVKLNEPVKEIAFNGEIAYYLTENGNLYISGGSGLQAATPIMIARNVTWLDDNGIWFITNNYLASFFSGSTEPYVRTNSLEGYTMLDAWYYQNSNYFRAKAVKDGNIYTVNFDGAVSSTAKQLNSDVVAGGIAVMGSYSGGVVYYVVTEEGLLFAYGNGRYSSYINGFVGMTAASYSDDPVLIPVVQTAENLNLLQTNLEDSGVLSGDTLELTMNKQLMNTKATIYENGTAMVAHTEISENILKITPAVGFVEGVQYKVVVSASGTKGISNVFLAEDIVMEFTYKAPVVAETTPDGDVPQDTTPDVILPDAPEEDPVVYESILDDAVARYWTTERLESALVDWKTENRLNGHFYGNALLNPISTDTEVSHWLRLQAPTVTVGEYSEIPLGGNYWGSVNERAIGLQMIDYADFPNYARLMYAPYLTEAPEDTFPFVTSVKLFNKYGEEVTTVGNEQIRFQVKFNRDMDTSIPLLVRFGSAYPYGDYEIEGAYVDARTWEGVYTLNTLIENGYQYFTISNGCSATDDLELQTDQYRFFFEIDTTAAQALIMQGTATDTGIRLTWTQDDFKTLMGYNVYRSTKEDGLYTRLNSTVISADTMEWFDDTVEPGVVYYYNFTVVQTDLSESEPSGKIVIMSKDTMAPNIYHSPIANAFTGANLVLDATVTDNLNIAYANLYYRVVGTDTWNIIRMNKLNDKYSAIIPAAYITVDGVEYYIEAFDGVSYTYKGSAEAPYTIAVQEALDENSLGDVDGDGVITNLDALLLLYTINDKYNMTAEEFARADLNGDGELWAAEALRILQYVSGVVGSVKM